MDTEKMNKIREIVRDVMDGKVNSLINDDIFMDNETRDRVWDRLTEEFTNDEEVVNSIFNGNDGYLHTEIVEPFIDDLTEAFMKRFE